MSEPQITIPPFPDADKPSEFFTLDGSRRVDAGLHAPLLDGAAGTLSADMENVVSAMESGLPADVAAGIYAGPGARAALVAGGVL